MAEWTHFANQLPLLLVCIPFCGIVTIGLISLIGREHLRRTFLLNGTLTFGCALLILSQFQFGTERTRLSSAESFQSVIVLSHSELSSGFRFGVDGCTLLLVLFVSTLPLLVYSVWAPPESKHQVSASPRTPEMTCGRAALVLLLQALLIIFLTALDRRVQLVTLLISTFVLFVELSISSSSGRRKCLSRWQCQTLLSDFLIAGGLLATLTPLVRLAGIGNNPDNLFDLVRVLEATELLRDEELSQYVRLMSAASPAMLVLLLGCSIRFGMFPWSGAARTMWEQTAPWQRLLIWTHGPLLGMAVVLRELQMFPIAAYQVIGYLKYAWLAGLFAFALVVKFSTGSRREAGLLVYLSSLLFFSLGGPNPVSLAGAFLLLAAGGLRLSISKEDASRLLIPRYLRQVSMFLMIAGAICTLIGAWQGVGPGARGLGFSLSMGLSLLILGTTGGRTSHPERRKSLSLNPHSSRSHAPAPGEQPIWDISPPSASLAVEPHWFTSIRSIGLILAICVLLALPNFFWKRIRWDLQKIEFPRGEISLTASEGQP